MVDYTKRLLSPQEGLHTEDIAQASDWFRKEFARIFSNYKTVDPVLEWRKVFQTAIQQDKQERLVLGLTQYGYYQRVREAAFQDFADFKDEDRINFVNAVITSARWKLKSNFLTYYGNEYHSSRPINFETYETLTLQQLPYSVVLNIVLSLNALDDVYSFLSAIRHNLSYDDLMQLYCSLPDDVMGRSIWIQSGAGLMADEVDVEVTLEDIFVRFASKFHPTLPLEWVRKMITSYRLISHRD